MEADVIVKGFSKSMQMYGCKYAKFIDHGDSNVHKKKKIYSISHDNLTVEKIKCTNYIAKHNQQIKRHCKN